MRLKSTFFYTFGFFLILWGLSAYAANHYVEVQKIDIEIKELEDMKRGYESRALRHENQAIYLQFEQQFVLETRRHIEIAEENRQKAAAVQRQIDRLQERRDQLIK